MINTTKTHLPSKEKYIKYIDEIYKNEWITNNGPLLQKLEKRLASYLGVKNIILVSNGTSALEIACRTLDLKGSVITTPFTFVATTSSLVVNNLIPIFADINKKTLNINPENIQSKIKEDTSAILPVHVFGNACEIEKITKIAKDNNLKVIYDAAHAFNVKYKEQSILNFGDISTISFHATKLFHTIEGGALIIKDDKLAKKARFLINFGIKNAESIPHLGTNAKMNEFEAAMGLCVLDDVENIMSSRKLIYKKYEKELSNIVQFQKINKNGTKNYSYFPIVFKNKKTLLRVREVLNKNDIYPRRYFYPSLDKLNYIKPKQKCENSRDISKRILCLPIYNNLESKVVNKIIQIIKDNI